MKFRFSLDSVLMVRKQQEKVQEQKLAKQLSKKKEIDQIRADIKEKLENYLKNAETRKFENIHNIKSHSKHMEVVHQKIKWLSDELDEIKNSVNDERTKLANAHKKRHMLEKMKEIEQENFAAEQARYEQKVMDEIATQKYSSEYK